MLKRTVYNIINAEPEAGVWGKGFVIGITVLIVLSVIMVVAESVASVADAYAAFFFWAEVFSVAVFTIEYVARLWTVTLNERYRQAVLGRVRYAGTFMMIIDLLAILPFYLPMFITVDLRVLRLLRLLRLARVFKLGRYARSMELFARVFYEKRSELSIAAVFFGFYLIMSSSILYLLENEAQPNAFSSIPAAMWWGAAALTTVGYGDIFPITALGKVMGAILAIFGIAMFALPVGILATGFVEAFDGMTQEKARTGRLEGEESAPTVTPTDDLEPEHRTAAQRVTLLERLSRLRTAGHLSEEEFLAAKARVLES